MTEFLRKAFAMCLVCFCTFTPRPVAQAAAGTADPALLTLDRIFGSDEFSGQGLGHYHWSRRTASYFTLEAPEVAGESRPCRLRNRTETLDPPIKILRVYRKPDGRRTNP